MAVPRGGDSETTPLLRGSERPQVESTTHAAPDRRVPSWAIVASVVVLCISASAVGIAGIRLRQSDTLASQPSFTSNAIFPPTEKLVTIDPSPRCARTYFDDHLPEAQRRRFEGVGWLGALFFGGTYRGNKVVLNYDTNDVYVPIWKDMTTTVSKMMKEAGQRVVGPHDTGYKFTYGPFSTDEVTSQFLARVPKPMVFTIVRDPVTRFVSAMRPHSVLPQCAGGNKGMCPEFVAEMRHLLHIMRDNGGQKFIELLSQSSADLIHQVPQTYFLSTTDATGARLRFDRVYRMEDMLGGAAAADLGDVDVGDAKNIHAGAMDDVYVAFVRNDPELAPMLCEVYAADFECLGYAKPPLC